MIFFWDGMGRGEGGGEDVGDRICWHGEKDDEMSLR